MKTVTISLKTVNRIVELSKECSEKDKSFSKEFHQKTFEEVLEDISEPLSKEMHKLIDSLPLNQKQELEALVWLGRGDFNSFESAYEQAKLSRGEGTASYLGAKPLYKYIPLGITLLQSEGISIDN